MKELRVQLKDDHLVRMTKVKKPLIAIAELIWNGFDADADNVTVSIEKNEVKGIDSITVKDNGHGISYDEANATFGSLGGSWKQKQGRTKKEKRILHGKAGKGRFRAFSLGSNVEWDTTYPVNGKGYNFQIKGSTLNIGTFFLTDRTTIDPSNTGTLVNITKIEKNFHSLTGDRAEHEITEQFALYLNEYPGLTLIYDNSKIDPSKMIDCKKTYELKPVQSERGIQYKAFLTIIEWNTSAERSLYLCDSEGFTLDRDLPKIQAPGFNFTAYLKSDYIKELDSENQLLLKDMNSVFRNLIDDARNNLRAHFRQRQAELATNMVESWKEENLYPYEGDPKDIIEETERQVFDICALNINQYLPDFENVEKKNKKLSFALIKQALKENPKSLRKILSNVLELPLDKQDDLANLLEKTTLASLINASKIVTDRLDFLKGIELIIFDPKYKSQLLERSQLHRIIADHTWIFGEEFNLSVDDESLTKVLSKHLKQLDKDRTELVPVERLDGSRGIVDLMLSKTIPRPKANENEHLIVELKRPKTKIGFEESNQIKSYAFAVVEDERFKDTNTTWHFIVISNEIKNEVRKEVTQRFRPQGLLYEDPDGKSFVWVKTWGEVIEDAKARLHIFQEKLQYNATTLTGIEYLKKTHEKYLPKNLTCEELLDSCEQ